jgi:hypothetical protein
MKTAKIVLVLLALLALIPCTQSMAQTQPATAPAPANAADFLATLSAPADAPAGIPATQTLPAPTFLSTSCTSSSQCPTGQLCCYPCGIDGCSNVCMNPVRGHCPFFP